MKNPISQKKAEEVRNRHLARQFPHVGRIIAERDAYKSALIAAGLPLPEVNPKKLIKFGPPAQSAPRENVNRVAILEEENARLEALIMSHGVDPSSTPRDPARGHHPDCQPVAKKVVAEVVEPESTTLPTEPEPVDESSADDWGDEPAPAEPAKKTDKKSAKKK